MKSTLDYSLRQRRNYIGFLLSLATGISAIIAILPLALVLTYVLVKGFSQLADDGFS